MILDNSCTMKIPLRTFLANLHEMVEEFAAYRRDTPDDFTLTQGDWEGEFLDWLEKREG